MDKFWSNANHVSVAPKLSEVLDFCDFWSPLGRLKLPAVLGSWIACFSAIHFGERRERHRHSAKVTKGPSHLQHQLGVGRLCRRYDYEGRLHMFSLSRRMSSFRELVKSVHCTENDPIHQSHLMGVALAPRQVV